jgi:hypothetical protein
VVEQDSRATSGRKASRWLANPLYKVWVEMIWFPKLYFDHSFIVYYTPSKKKCDSCCSNYHKFDWIIL